VPAPSGDTTMGPLPHSVKSAGTGRDAEHGVPFARAEPYTKGLNICVIGQKRVL
jgi:hypothetical protein